MLTYEEIKGKAIRTFTDATLAYALARDHDEARKVLNSVIEAARLGLWLEDLTEAHEKDDLIGVMTAQAKNGF